MGLWPRDIDSFFNNLTDHRMRIRIMVLLAFTASGCTTATQTVLLNHATSQARISPSGRELANGTTRAAPPPSSTSPRDSRRSATASAARGSDDFAGNYTGAPLPNERGAVTAGHFEVRQDVLPKGQTQLMQRKVDAILQRFLQTPALGSLQGFSIDQHIILDAMAGSPAAGAEGFLLVRRVDPAKSKRDKATGALLGVGEGPGIRVRINDQSAILGYTIGKDSQGDFYQVPAKPERLHGFPVYGQGSSDIVVIAKPGRLPFTPISKQRYLAYLSQINRGAAEELARLSEAERREPACPNHELRGSRLIDCNAPSATYYVTLNPGYFDASKPKASIELITINVVGKRSLNDKALGTLVRQAVSQLDLGSMQNSLD